MKPGDPKTGFDSTLRRVLAGDSRPDAGAGPQPNVQDCPSADLLAAYFERSLVSDETKRFGVHLATCARCRAQLAAMVRAEAPGQTAHERPGLTFWDWRWLAPAVAALAAIVIWAGVHERRSTTTEPVIVATNRNEPAPSIAPPQGAAASAPGDETDSAQTPEQGATRVAPQARSATSTGSAATQMAAPPAQMTNRAVAKENSNAAGTVGGLVVGESPSANELNKKAARAPSVALTQEAPNGNVDTNATSQDQVTVSAAAPLAQPEGAPAARSQTQKMMAPRHAAPSQQSLSPELRSGVAETVNVVAGPLTIPSPDPSKLWRIANSGAIEFSSDSGSTWTAQTAPLPQTVSMGSSPATKICWIVGAAGLIYRTVNGTEWKRVPPPVESDLISVRAKDAKHATVTSADGSSYVTKDGGKSWHPQENP